VQKSFDDIIKESIRDVLKSKVNSIEQQRKEFVKDIIEKDVDDLVAGDLTLLNEDEIKIIFNKVNEKYGKEFNVQLKWMEFWESNGHYILIKIGKRSVPYIVLFNALYYQDDNKNVYHLNKLEDGIKMLREYRLLKISQVNDFYEKVEKFKNLNESIKDKLKSKANSISKQKEQYIKEIMGNKSLFDTTPEERIKLMEISPILLKPIFDEVKKQISDNNTSGEIIINHQVIILKIEKQHEQKTSLMTFLSFDYPSGKYILRQYGLKTTSFENYNDMLNKLKEIL
jgi:hypothetical protein